MDPVYLTLSKLRRKKYDEAVSICTSLLEQNPYDQAAWYLKCRAMTGKSYIDDTEMEDEGMAEILLDENAIASAPRYTQKFSHYIFVCMHVQCVFVL
jgi:tetratricopeptide repeat protein 8